MMIFVLNKTMNVDESTAMGMDSGAPQPFERVERRVSNNIVDKTDLNSEESVEEPLEIRAKSSVDVSSKEVHNMTKFYDSDLFFRPRVEDWDMPNWIKDYIEFHREARRKYPGDELFTTNDTNAPKILVRICKYKNKTSNKT